MLIRTEGIVLTTQKYGEADLIVTHLSPDRGIIRSFAKSPRKIKSRFGSSLEPLTHAKISLWGKEQSLPRITQSDIISSFHRIRESYRDFVHISKLVEILVALTPQGIPNRQLFSFFLNVLSLITSAKEGPTEGLHLITRIRLLAVIGYAPRLEGCGRCGTKSLHFYLEAGTTLCGKCVSVPANATGASIRLNDRTIHFYSHAIEWPIHISHRLKPDTRVLEELSGLIDTHVSYILSRKLLSARFPAGIAPC